jgi:hypothetical protein
MKPFVLAPTPAQLGKAPLQRRQSQGNCIPVSMQQSPLSVSFGATSFMEPCKDTERNEGDKSTTTNTSMEERSADERMEVDEDQKLNSGMSSEVEERSGEAEPTQMDDDGSGELTICEQDTEQEPEERKVEDEGIRDSESAAVAGLKGFFKKIVEDGMEK